MWNRLALGAEGIRQCGVCGVVPMAPLVPVLLAGAYLHYRGIGTAAVCNGSRSAIVEPASASSEGVGYRAQQCLFLARRKIETGTCS